MHLKKVQILNKIARAIICTGIPKTNTRWYIYKKNNSSYISTGTTQMDALVDYEALVTG